MAKFIRFKQGSREHLLNLDSLHNAESYMSQSYGEDDTPKGEPYRILILYFGPTHGGISEDGTGDFRCDQITLYRDEADIVWQKLLEASDANPA